MTKLGRIFTAIRYKSKAPAKTHSFSTSKNLKIPKILARSPLILGNKYSLDSNEAAPRKSVIKTLFFYVAIPQTNKASSTTAPDDIISEKSKKRVDNKKSCHYNKVYFLIIH